MWLLKSPKNGKAVSFEDFITEDLKCKSPLHNAMVIYEKLAYMLQLDHALLLIADLINSYRGNKLFYPKKMYTYSNEEIEILFNHKRYISENSRIVKYYMDGVVDFIKNIADKVEYCETEISDIFKKEITEIRKYNWKNIEVEQTIFDFCDKNVKYLKSVKDVDLNKEYNKISDDVYKKQKEMAKTIFYEMDEIDKKGLFNVYKNFLSLFLHTNRDLIKHYKNSEHFKLLINSFPLIEKDFDFLLSNDSIKNGDPYINIKNDLSLEWLRSINCFGNYFIFISNDKDKSMNWNKLKKLFTQYKDVDIANNCRKKTKDIYTLLAKINSFDYLYKNNQINSKFNNKDDIEKILKIKNELL